MGYQIKQSSTEKPLVFFMYDSTTHLLKSGMGSTPVVTLSKNGGAFASAAGAITEIAGGAYQVAANATDSATLGPLILQATGTGADAYMDVFDVGAYDTQNANSLGLANLANAVPTTAAVATAVWTDTTAGDFATATSPGKIIFTQLGTAFTTTSSSVFTTGALANAPVTAAAPTAAAVATAVWTDTTAGDFTTATSPGKIIFTQLGTAFTTTSSSIFTTGSLANAPTAPTAAAVATAVWTDTTAGDFTTATSPGKIIFTQLGGAFTTSSSSIYSGASLANAPAAPTAASVATAVWTDTTAGDFTTASSPGKILQAQLGGTFTTTSSSVFSTPSLVNAPTGGSAPSAATIATAVWTDTTAGDFTTLGSPGKILQSQLGTAFTTTSSSIFTTGALANAPAAPTAASVATAVWTDTTAGDFTTATSPGKIIFSQLGGTFTTTSSSVFSTPSLVNAPTGGSAPSAATIATAVWTDTTAGDFTTLGSPGKILQAQLGNAFTTTSSSVFTTGALANATVTLGANAPAGWLNSAAFAAGALTSSTFTAGTYPIKTGLDFTNVNNATSATTLNNITIPNVNTVLNPVVLGSSNAGALTSASFATGVYPMQVGPDFTNVKQATAPTTLTNLTVPNVTNIIATPSWYTTSSAAAIATAVWQDTTPGDFTTAGSVGIRLMSGTSLFDSVMVETGTPTFNARQSLSIILAGAGGTVTGANSSPIIINGAGTSTARITSPTPDMYGDRPTVTLNPPA